MRPPYDAALVLGVLSTQTYAQSVLAGRSDRVAVSGALWSALLIPPIGLGSALVGMVMRMRHPDMTPAQAFPRFVLEFMPDWLGGVVLATLLITVLVAGAGPSCEEIPTEEELRGQMARLMREGQSRKAAAKDLAVRYGLPAKKLYDLSLGTPAEN